MHSIRLGVTLCGIVLIAACSSRDVGATRDASGPMTCTNVSPIAASRMQGQPGSPLRCGPQSELPYTLAR